MPSYRASLLIAALTAAGTTTAAAQPAPEPAPTAPAEDAPPPAEAAAPAAAPTPSPVETVTPGDRDEPAGTGATATTTATAPPAPRLRPEGTTLGLGVGYRFPAGLDRPNLVGARLRLRSGIAFEPVIGFTNAAQTADDGDDETKDAATALAVAANVRVPVASRGRGDLVLVGGASLGYFLADPDGDDNDRTRTVATLQWGAAIDYWLTDALSVSATTTNPLVSYQADTLDQPAGPSMTTTTAQIAAIWAPRLEVMLHLYW